MIRPHLRDLIDEHKPIIELNNSNNREERKIQLIIKNNFISVKYFEDTRNMYLASKPAEIFMGSDTENIIDTLFKTILNKLE